MNASRFTPRQIALAGLALTVAAVQYSIAISQVFFACALAAWAVTLVTERRRPSAPPWMVPLMLYAGWTLVSTAFSPDLVGSLRECKQLVLLLLVPLTYEIVDQDSALMLTTIILVTGAFSAVIGIGQFAILHHDLLDQRVRSTLGHYMTFSGLMMLVLNVALARVLFIKRSRIWPALVIPIVAVVLELSFTRSAWVGAACALAVLLTMRDVRLIAALPAAAAIAFGIAPARVHQRFYSIFNLHHSIFNLSDPAIRDRFAMIRAGVRIVRAHPIVGVGPNMIARIYPEYREPDAVLQTPPHLHNVPVQIAAERGLPAVALWIWFIGAVLTGAAGIFRNAPRDGPVRFLSATAVASVVAMLGEGMTEHNFGDSEFQMFFLVLITLPFAVMKLPGAGSGPLSDSAVASHRDDRHPRSALHQKRWPAHSTTSSQYVCRRLTSVSGWVRSYPPCKRGSAVR
jgi:putative inorganic carbon (HCO3(-)) transporter